MKSYHLKKKKRETNQIKNSKYLISIDEKSSKLRCKTDKKMLDK